MTDNTPVTILREKMAANASACRQRIFSERGHYKMSSEVYAISEMLIAYVSYDQANIRVMLDFSDTAEQPTPPELMKIGAVCKKCHREICICAQIEVIGLYAPPATETRADHCPKCDSPDPARHPAMQFEGEVQICPHPWHGPSSSTDSGIVEQLRYFGCVQGIESRIQGVCNKAASRIETLEKERDKYLEDLKIEAGCHAAKLKRAEEAEEIAGAIGKELEAMAFRNEKAEAEAKRLRDYLTLRGHMTNCLGLSRNYDCICGFREALQEPSHG